MAAPDMRDYTLWMEREVFWLEHALLVFVPAWCIASGHFLVVPKSVALACASWSLNALYHVLVLSVVAVISGKNLNYMLQPPPGAL
jgi:hypothetical protein